MRITNVCLSILFAALSVAPASAKQPSTSPGPKPPEIYVVGEAVFVDSGCVGLFGLPDLTERARAYNLRLNGSALISGVDGYVLLTAVKPTSITATSVAGYFQNAQKDKAFWQTMSATGADLGYLWGKVLGHAADGPSSRVGFKRENALAYTTCGSPAELILHEAWHRFGCHHNPEASEPPPNPTSWPDAVGQLFAGETCDAVSYCRRPLPVLSHDTTHNNAGMANRSFPWVAAYNATAPISLDRTCEDAIDLACLADRLLVKVQWADLASNPFTGFARIRRASNASASFVVAGAVVRVTATSRTVRRDGRNVVVTDLGLVAPSTTVGYRIIVTDTASGRVRAWQQTGQGFTLNVPEAF